MEESSLHITATCRLLTCTPLLRKIFVPAARPFRDVSSLGKIGLLLLRRSTFSLVPDAKLPHVSPFNVTIQYGDMFNGCTRNSTLHSSNGNVFGGSTMGTWRLLQKDNFETKRKRAEIALFCVLTLDSSLPEQCLVHSASGSVVQAHATCRCKVHICCTGTPYVNENLASLKLTRAFGHCMQNAYFRYVCGANYS